jgi:hypothetical protein
VSRVATLLLLALLATPAAAKTGVDASALYNRGSDALRRGDLGPAVAQLLAARRIDPRAHDIRTNLAIARSRVDEREGGDQASTRIPSALALSAPEAWNLAGALAAMGALLLLLAASRRGLLILGGSVFAAGAFFGLGLLLRAREEARHPTAVVVAPMLEVLPAPEERPVSPYLLGAGEEVRLGTTRGDLVQIRVGGNTIGWARRSGLWRVDEAPRYTASSGSK